ncbi:hypothetical protein [Sinorhizobium meliloti]|uniref:hypothetical protein n=1 Tax=Rhizobium meliloti TaxID=382 RepID=UPI000FDA4025|nr:hypothetical protein [Sinorhizobium meliloti]RVL63358.1 hypothetical protein CN137_12395 [Sinorhizobium meliloti]
MNGKNLLAIMVDTSLIGFGPAFAIDLECREFRSLVISDEIKRPKPPYCATSAISFFDEYQFQSCRSEMLDYQAKMERYGKCLQRENSEAVAEFNETVESFNQLASR